MQKKMQLFVLLNNRDAFQVKTECFEASNVRVIEFKKYKKGTIMLNLIY